MEYRTLAGISTADIHDAFVDAFGSYEVPMSLSVTELTAMMDSRDVSLTLSVGCFDADTLVGFVLVGVRDGAHGCVTYDAATGVRQGHQNKGIGSGLLHALWAQLRAAGAVSFQLEVLENNTAAQTLYERHGCTTTRRFVCVRTQRSPDRRLPPGWELRSALPAGIDEALYNGYVPSWQQAVAVGTGGLLRGAYRRVRCGCVRHHQCHEWECDAAWDTSRLALDNTRCRSRPGSCLADQLRPVAVCQYRRRIVDGVCIVGIRLGAVCVPTGDDARALTYDRYQPIQ